MKRNWLAPLLLGTTIAAVVPIGGTSAAQPFGSQEDEDSIRQLMAATTEAFNRHDAKALAQLYTPDADLVTVRGERMKGTAGIERGLGAIFATRAKGATLRPLDMTIRFITADVAVVHVTNELSGLESASRDKPPPHRELSIRVLVKEQGTWRVAAFHNTLVNPF